MNTINDIVEISQIQAGIIKVEITEINITRMLADLTKHLKPDIESKNLDFRVVNKLSGHLETVKTDDKKLNSVLVNLLKNAVKFTNEGYIEIEIRRDTTYLEFSIKDSGVGIPKDKFEAIFDRFSQVDVSSTRQYEGSGLGLSITKAYVEMLGGRIWVESEIGQGSVFFFTIPTDNISNISLKDIKGTDDEGIYGKRLKILIAENDLISELYISAIVEDISNEILVVKTGTDAVDCCRNNPDIDVILMDINMIEMDGYEATQQIRQFNKDVIIIAQTAFGLPGDSEKAFESGCNDYISKPINQKELKDKIKRLISL
jgi:CheY-like chemotaxis protein